MIRVLNETFGRENVENILYTIIIVAILFGFWLGRLSMNKKMGFFTVILLIVLVALLAFGYLV